MNPRNRYVARTIEALRRSTAMAGSRSVLYVALGDSVTAGWLEHGVMDSSIAYPSRFRDRLAGLFPRAMISVLNAGLGGEGVEGALARVERDVLRHEPSLVTICLGLNDARSGREGLNPFRERLTALVDEIKPAADVLLITPNTRGDALQEEGILDEYVRQIRSVARDREVGVADVYAVYHGWVRAGAVPADLLSNRISHPTREGHKIFANGLIEFFQPG